MGGTGKTTHEDSITFTEDEDPWWRKVFCWVKAKHNSARGSSTASGSLLETQQQDEHGAPEGNQLRTQNSDLSDVSSLGTPGSGRSTSRLTMRSLHKIKEEMSLKKSYDVKFSFKRGYEAEFKTVRMLGRGAFGSVFLAMRRVPLDPAEPEVFAVKRIKKDMLKSKRHGHALLLEIEIMMRLRNNLNVVHFEDAYEDDRAVYMVMEHCSGGDLIANSKANPNLSEADIRVYFQDIVRLVGQCHRNNVLHRDIKPDNFLKANKTAKSPLKMIDFGLSCMWTGKQLRDTTGTPFYMAPEVLLKKGYSHPADLWAAGCVLYFLVEGTNPFEPCDTFQNLCHKVSSRPVGFKSQVWTKVSPQLKDLCARLLERDPEKRFTYQQAMDHPWLNVDTYPSAALNDTMVQKFQSHGSFHRLKRKVLTEALKYLELEETGELAMIFSKLDVDHDGFITKKEMVRGLQQYGYKVSNHDSKVIIENVDVDGNGQLDQNEFVVALLDLKTLQKDRKWQQIVTKLFSEMDKDNDGQLCAEEIKAAIPYSEWMEEIDDEVQEIIAEADDDGDNKISVQEFTKMLNETAETLETYDKRLNKRYASTKFF